MADTYTLADLMRERREAPAQQGSLGSLSSGLDHMSPYGEEVLQGVMRLRPPNWRVGTRLSDNVDDRTGLGPDEMSPMQAADRARYDAAHSTISDRLTPEFIDLLARLPPQLGDPLRHEYFHGGYYYPQALAARLNHYVQRRIERQMGVAAPEPAPGIVPMPEARE